MKLYELKKTMTEMLQALTSKEFLADTIQSRNLALAESVERLKNKIKSRIKKTDKEKILELYPEKKYLALAGIMTDKQILAMVKKGKVKSGD